MGRYLLILLLPCTLQGQDIPFLEALSENSGGGELEDVLSSFPVHVNEVSAVQLRATQLLSEDQVQEFLEYRSAYGMILSKYELQAIGSFSPELIRQLEKFLTMEESPFGSGSSGDTGKGAGEFTILAARRFRDRGSQIRTRTRWRSGDKVEFSIRTDHDAGEKIRFRPGNYQWGFDHVNTYLRISKRRSELIAGHYRIHFGQGLMQQGAFGMGKGAALPLPSGSSHIAPYGTFQESGGMFGLSFMFRQKRLRFIAYSSLKREDASIQDDGSFGSLTTSGIHRSSSELAKRKRVSLFTNGIMAEAQWPNAVIGAGLNIDRTSHPVRRRFYYSSILPAGHVTGQGSVHGRYRYKNMMLWSELAISTDGSAFLTGLSIAFDRNIEWITLFRDYSPAYFTWHGKGFGEQGSGNRNETGLYQGLRLIKKKKFDLTVYADLYHFPWFSYQRRNAVRGHELRIDFSLYAGRTVVMRLIHTAEFRDTDLSSWGADQARRKFQLHVRKTLQRHELRLRVQGNSLSGDSRQSGFLVSADMIINRNRTQWNGRVMYFSTSSYDTREFISERDVWGSFSLPSYYGRGLRTVWMLRYKPVSRLTLWIRFAGTIDLPSRRFQNELKVQLKIVM